MKIEKVDNIKAPGDGILSVSFQPHPIDHKWNFERISICGEKGVSIWSFDYNGNHRKLSFIESITNSIIKLCRWSSDGKYLAVVDMEQVSIYYKNDENTCYSSNNFKSYNSRNDDETVISDDKSEQPLENWAIYTSFPSSDINECTDICWLKGSKILINGTVSGNLLVYNIEEKCQSCNLFVKDIIEMGLKNRNIKQNVHEVGHVSGLNTDNRGLFLACQMSNKRLYIFEIMYNYKENDKKNFSKRNCIQLSYLLEEDRLISNSPCIFTFIRRPIFDPVTCLIGCPYGEVRTSYFSCLYPFRDVSDSYPFGWMKLKKNSNNNSDKMEDVWSLNSISNISSINGKLEFPEAYRLRGHQRRIRLFEFSSTIITGNDELFTFCAQSSQDGSVSFWKVIYDLSNVDKIKSIECFLVLSNFMDEQASVTGISFNNMNNTILIGSDDNKLTLINFEFDEFSLLKSSIINSSNIYDSNWNVWNYDYIPEKPSVDILNSTINQNDIQDNTQKVKVPIITVNEIIKHQERTEESKITSKGTKIRRIQPINLSLIQKNEDTSSTIHNNGNVENEVNKSNEDDIDIVKTTNYGLKITNNDDKRNGISEDVLSNIDENTKINSNIDSSEIQINNSVNANNNKYKENNSNNDLNTNNNTGTCKDSLKLLEKSSDESNNNDINVDFYLGLFMREWVNNIKYPKRLSVNFDTIIDEKTYKMCIFVDNRKVLENINKSREIKTEIICVKQEKNNNDDTLDNIKKDVQWFKPISNNNIVTNLIRIRDILLIFYSNYVDKNNSLFINTNIDILNAKTGTNIITGITIPYVLKLTLCSSLDMILLVTINGKLKLLELPSTTTCNYKSVQINIDWILDADWSYLNNSKLSRVDLFSHKNRNIDVFRKNTSSDIIKRPTIVLYYDDGKVFTYSFSLSNFIRIDDLQYYKSDYWSMIFQKTALEYTKNGDKRFSIIEDLSVSASDEYDEYESEVCNITTDINEDKNDDMDTNQYECDEKIKKQDYFSHNSFLLREIQKTSRFVHLGSQIRKDPHEKIFTLFGHIIGKLLSTEKTCPNESEHIDDAYEIHKRRSIMCTRMHIEHQMTSSLVVKSRNEFKYWFKVYLKHTLESFEYDLLKEIVNHCIEMIKESILASPCSKYIKNTLAIPVWHNYSMLEILDLDPIQLLLNDVIPFIDEYINILETPEDISNLTKLYDDKVNTIENIRQYRSELVGIKAEISSRIKKITEEYEENKSLKLNCYNTQSNYSSQSSNTNNNNSNDYHSRLDFLNSIF